MIILNILLLHLPGLADSENKSNENKSNETNFNKLTFRIGLKKLM
jgi:hypothetical protein